MDYLVRDIHQMLLHFSLFSFSFIPATNQDTISSFILVLSRFIFTPGSPGAMDISCCQCPAEGCSLDSSSNTSRQLTDGGYTV